MTSSNSLVKDEVWAKAKKSLLLSANLTWISILVMAVSFLILMVTFTQSGAEMPTDSSIVTTLPDGVIGLVGWANRFLVVVYCAWVMIVARLASKLGE